MPRQFSPAPRSTVLSSAKNRELSFDASPLGEGVMVRQKHDADVTEMFTGLMENYGWYVASYEVQDGGDLYTLMPVTEVP
jgi:hypothetical protein